MSENRAHLPLALKMRGDGRTIIGYNREAIFQRFAEPPPDLAGAVAAVDSQQQRTLAHGLVVQICAWDFEDRHGHTGWM
jgi:hypothetical protein